jgi:UDP-N-acetylmuramoyl-tripeptide--D-alanyl-D-alanine ligase
MIGTMGVDYLLGLGPFSEEMLTEAQSGLNPPQKAFWASDHKKAIDLLRGIIREGDWLLVKGSHGLDMESIVRALEEQG